MYTLFLSLLQEIINFLRHTSYGATYATGMSPPITQMVISAMKIVMGEDGTNEGAVIFTVLHVYFC